ncbi:MAG: ribose-phosphate pyrophosphokinase [Gemmatimonadales bacterium]|nr:ribose-phosphate pyrophosphokinase [Gemmatimonadales bacterium]
MTLLILPLPGNEEAAQALAERNAAEVGALTVRRFPDGETYVRLETEVRDRDVALVSSLHRPDDKLLPLAFVAETARDLGSRSIGLVAPYLAYLRQDRRFQEGEGVTSRYFARLISGSVDWLVTIDPHLHRLPSLGAVYAIPTRVLHAAPHVSAWIREQVPQALLVGPDAESAQWVEAVAHGANLPFVVLEKVRRGDRDVAVSVPEVDRWRERTPVLVDDIISTGRTMIETVGHLQRAGLRPPVCIGVHAVFADRAYEDLLAAGAAAVITCNTIPHPSNRIDLTPLLAEGVAAFTPDTTGAVAT